MTQHPPSFGRVITARFPGRCAYCGQRIQAGAQIWWTGHTEKHGKRVMHLECCKHHDQQQKPQQQDQGEQQDAQGQQGEQAEQPQQPQQQGQNAQGEAQEQAEGAERSEGESRRDEAYTPPQSFQQRPPQPANLKGTWVVKECDSLQDLLAYAQQEPKRSANIEVWKGLQEAEWRAERSEKWFGVKGGYKAVEQIVRDGWPEGVKKMFDALGQLRDVVKPQSVRRRMEWRGQGDEYDIHRAWSGQFDKAWRRPVRKAGVGPLHVRLLCNTTESASTAAESMFWRGAVTLFLADALTEAGYNVEIVSANVTMHLDSTHKINSLILTTLKDARAPVELNSLAAALCLAGCTRYYAYRGYVHTCDEIGKDARADLGRASVYAKYAQTQPGEYEIPNPHDADTARAAVEKIVKQLEQQQDQSKAA